jgi:hypothetical protein
VDVDSRSAFAAAAMVAALLMPQASKPAAPPANAAEVTFGSEVLKTGTKLTVSSENVWNSITMRPGASGNETISTGLNTGTANFTATVEHSDTSLDRVKFEFAKCPFSTTPPVKNAPTELKVANKTYEVSSPDGKAKIVDGSGAPVPELELIALHGYTNPLTLELPLVRVLGGKTIKRGEAVDVPWGVSGLVFTGFHSMAPGGTTTLTLTDERVVDGQECAVFKVAATVPQLGNAQFRSRVELEVTGEVVVTKRHCLLVGVNSEGVYAFPDAKGTGPDKKPAKERKPAKDAPKKETWKYHVVILG